MENLLEIAKNTVALLIAARIIIAAVLLAVVIKALFTIAKSPEAKRKWSEAKQFFSRYARVFRES